MTDQQRDSPGWEQRLSGALQVARARRARRQRRLDQRRSHGLSAFGRTGLERHHPSETDQTG